MKPRASFVTRHKETYYFSSTLVILAFLISVMPFVGMYGQTKASAGLQAGEPQVVTLGIDLEGKTLGINPILLADASDVLKDTKKVDFYYREVGLDSAGEPVSIATDDDPSDGWSCTWQNIGLADGPYELRYIAKAKN